MNLAPASPEPLLTPKKSGFSWPRRLPWRLALGFGTLVGMMLLALALASWQIRTMTALTAQFATQDMQRLLRVQSCRSPRRVLATPCCI
jgi:hypothetical protein